MNSILVKLIRLSFLGFLYFLDCTTFTLSLFSSPILVLWKFYKYYLLLISELIFRYFIHFIKKIIKN